MTDYRGDFHEFKTRLRNAGVSEEEFDIEDYAGLTFDELLGLTQQAIARHNSKIMEENVCI